MADGRHPIYISYAWGEEDELGDQLYSSLKKDGYDVRRDKESAGKYRASIGDFMDELAQGAAIVVILSPKYLESSFCMRELLDIYRHLSFKERIFPLVLPGTKIFSAKDRGRCALYWKKETEELQAQAHELGAALFGAADQQELRRMRAFSAEVMDMLSAIADLNLKTIEDLAEDDFRAIKAALERVPNLRAPASLKEGPDTVPESVREVIKAAIGGLREETLERMGQGFGGVDPKPSRLAVALVSEVAAVFLRKMDVLHNMAPDDEIRQAMDDLVRLVLPWTRDRRAYSRCECQKNGTYLVEVTTEAMVEAAMAGVDRRPAVFQYAGERIFGLNAHLQYLDAGSDIDGALQLDDIRQSIAERYGIGVDDVADQLQYFIDQVEDYAAMGLSDPDSAPHYILLKTGQAKVDDVVIQRINDKLPAMRVAQFSATPDQARTENMIMIGLKRIVLRGGPEKS